MAALGFFVPFNMAGTSAEKTACQVVAPANQRVKVVGIELSTDGTTSTTATTVVRVLRQTTAGTSPSSLTPVLNEKELTETIQTTAGGSPSAEPTAGDVLKRISIPSYNGCYEFYFPLGQEVVVQGGGRLGIACNVPTGVNVYGTLYCEE